MNKHWPRWIFASVTKHFGDNLEDLDVFYEGQKRSAEDYSTDLVEVRVDGPYFLQLGATLWLAKMEANLLVQAAMDDHDFHKIHSMVGIVAKAFTSGIVVYKYGDGPDDDDSIIGCLELLQDRRDRDLLTINHFGQINPDRQLLQATVEGHYSIQLTG